MRDSGAGTALTLEDYLRVIVPGIRANALAAYLPAATRTLLFRFPLAGS